VSGPTATQLRAIPSDGAHFLLVEKIGEGSFGEVFHARDTWLDHAVALKLLKPELADLSRLLHEARTLEQIAISTSSGSTVPTSTRAQSGSGWNSFAAARWRMSLPARVFAVRTKRRSSGRTCRALAAVHGKGIVHRDVKGRNVMREFDLEY